MIEEVERLVDLDNNSPYLFVNKRARKDGKRYTNKALSTIWKAACEQVGETITLYPGTKHSGVCIMINEKGMPLSDIQVVILFRFQDVTNPGPVGQTADSCFVCRHFCQPKFCLGSCGIKRVENTVGEIVPAQDIPDLFRRI